jgi:hypothetical protein
VRFVRTIGASCLSTLIVACGGGATSTVRPTAPAITLAPNPSIAVASVAVSPVAGASQAAASGGLPSANELCALLTTQDWSNVQLQPRPQPTINTDGPGSAYCTWTDISGAQGGLELDAFVDDTPSIAEDTYNTAAALMSGGQPIDLPGVDSALINPNINGTYGALLARTGRFTYSISLPAGAGSQAQLETLGGLVLSRSQQYR